MLEAVLNILYLLLDEPLLLLLDVELMLAVVLKRQIIHILDELLANILESLEPAGKQEEGLDVLLASRCHSALQGGDLLIDAAGLVSHRQEDEQDNFGLSGAWALVLVLLHLGKHLRLVELPVKDTGAVALVVLPVEDHDGHGGLVLDC